MEDTLTNGLTMLVAPPTPPPACLSTLTVVADTTAAGQQRYYKAEDIEQLLAGFSTPAADAELAELLRLEQQATPGPWEHTEAFFVACPRQYHIVDTWERQTPKAESKGNAALIAAMRNALPGLLARHRTSQEIIGYHTRETAALRRYIDVFQQELLAHPELPESIHKVVYAHRQTLIVAKDQAEGKECNTCGGLGCPNCHGGASGKEVAHA